MKLPQLPVGTSRFRAAPAAALLFAALASTPLAAQDRPMPDHPALQEAFVAWDEGHYPTALRGYLEVLRSAEGDAWLEEIALLTGELYRVDEVAPDGRGVQVSPDGALGAFWFEAGGRVVTRVIDMETLATVRELEGNAVVLGPGGRIAHAEVEETEALRAAREAVAAATDRRARFQAMQRAALEEVRASRPVLWEGGTRRAIDLGSRMPFNFAFASGTGELYVVAAERENPQRQSVVRVTPDGVEEVDFGGVQVRGLLAAPDGATLVAVGPRDAVVRYADGTLRTLEGATSPSLSTDGRVLAYQVNGDGVSRLEALELAAPGAEPRVLLETDRRLGAPAVSPDGGYVAYQLMELHDWEVFAVPTDGGETVRLSLEIQHDRNPIWVDDGHVLAAKGEGRHMRSYLYDLEGGWPVKLFHNNTVRTIAPEYEWAVAPGTGRILIVSERDGDTVSPERGVYLLDLNRTVTKAEVEERLERNLAAEEDLRRRGEAVFAPFREEVADATARVSVSRIYQYARDVYRFGSKHITMPGNAKAIEYYADKLRSFGYEPELQWFEPRPGIRTANVIVRIPGTVNPELVYVASSHFDSVDRGPGADDDSSGATALLEAARVLKDFPRRATIELAFFTGEEAGLLGSREYVRRAVEEGKRIVGALNNDMVGWSENHRLDNTIRYSNPGIRDIQHAAAMQFSDLITYDALYYKSTDAAAYYEAYGDIVGGIGSYPVLGNPHYHQWTDRLETINQNLVAEVSRVTVATLMLLASSPSRINGLVVEDDVARWEPSPETGVLGYEVEWETADGVRRVRVDAPGARLTGRAPGTEVRVRAYAGNGSVGWDWARAR